MAKKATIRFYRGNAVGLPVLLEGEPGLAKDTGELYIGTAAGNKRVLTTDDMEKRNPKQAVIAASTANIDLTTGGLLTIDGVTLTAGARVLVKDQTDQTQNGIYIAAAGAWTRAVDANTAEKLDSAYVYVTKGTDNKDKAFLQITDDIVLGTSLLIWTVAANDVDGGDW